MQSMPMNTRLEETLTSIGFLVFTLIRYISVMKPAKDADHPSARPTLPGFLNALRAK